MRDEFEIYNQAKAYLSKYSQELTHLKAISEIRTNAEINLDSKLAEITEKLENSEISKTALKDMVKGHIEVRTCKNSLRLAENDEMLSKEKLKYLEMCYNLEKKMLDSVNADKKYINGW